VRDVSFVAQDGQITGLLGPNGAGKTTSLRMLTGLVQPSSGTVEMDGQKISSQNRDYLQSLAILPDSHGIYQRLTARENIRYFGELRGLSGKSLEQRIDALIEELDLRGVADRKTSGFSQGERMKVNLARALIHDPQNILLDEPTNGLDVMSTRLVRRAILRFREAGKCVIFSSHIMQEVAALCDTLVIVAQGRVVAQGTPDEIRNHAGTESLEDAFVRLSGLDSDEIEVQG
jgi:sodium transport system ATP-binding protein